MFKVITAIFVVLLLLQNAPVWAAQDATDEWNAIAHSFNFDETTEVSLPDPTFQQAYNGSDFTRDFAAALHAVARAMATTLPPYDGDDKLGASLQLWPDS
jgi:hypothetical protein